jgi:hypothetical protein
MAKCSKAEVTKRVHALVPLRLNNVGFLGIRQYASSQEWNVTDRHLRRYVRRCDDLLAGYLERDTKRLVSRHLVLRGHILNLALEAGDLRTALAAAKDEAALVGIYAPKKYTNTDLSGDNPATHLTPEEIDALKVKLAARLTNPPAANGSAPEPAKP